jgi:ribose 5-phosphate isomerase A
VLGSRGKLPVEVLPFGLGATSGHLRRLGLDPQPRLAGDQPVVTDNCNQILDCGTGPIGDASKLEAAIRSIPGVIGTGLFLGLASVILIQRGETVEVRQVN